MNTVGFGIGFGLGPFRFGFRLRAPRFSGRGVGGGGLGGADDIVLLLLQALVLVVAAGFLTLPWALQLDVLPFAGLLFVGKAIWLAGFDDRPSLTGWQKVADWLVIVWVVSYVVIAFLYLVVIGWQGLRISLPAILAAGESWECPGCWHAGLPSALNDFAVMVYVAVWVVLWLVCFPAGLGYTIVSESNQPESGLEVLGFRFLLAAVLLFSQVPLRWRVPWFMPPFSVRGLLLNSQVWLNAVLWVVVAVAMLVLLSTKADNFRRPSRETVFGALAVLVGCIWLVYVFRWRGVATPFPESLTREARRLPRGWRSASFPVRDSTFLFVHNWFSSPGSFTLFLHRWIRIQLLGSIVVLFWSAWLIRKNLESYTSRSG